MVFKLLRIDATDARKIPLVVGKHLIGRGSGKFLQCDDKRVSRQHGELEVTDNSLTLKALHTNPCFYLRKGTVDRQMLKQNESVSLGNCDKFGLLPADCWYEIIYLPDNDIDKDKDAHETNEQISESNRTAMLDSTEVNTEALGNRTVGSPSLAPQPPSENKTDEPHVDDRPFSPNVSDQSQSLLQNGDLPSTSVSDPLPLLQSDQPQTSDRRSNSVEHQPMKFKIEPADWDSAQPSPMKRQLPSTSDVKTEPSEEGKRIKTEPDDVLIPGSSAQNGNQDDGAAAGPAMPPSPATPPPPRPRERCMYGANCYRKNENHKKQFSHPSDPDWGPGARGVCPFGARCVRRNPRHWLQNTHPPGTVPPADRQQGKRQRRKKKRESTDTDTEEDTPDDVIVTGKRARKKIDIQKWSDSEEEEEDPFQTDDEEDEWQPSGSLDQDTQYTQDD